MVKGMEGLTEDQKKALRTSKFAPLPPPHSSSSRVMPRLAHPGGPVKTNKAAALAKFLERKLQEPGGLDTLKPELIELAVKNAKDTVNASGTSKNGTPIQHVASFDDDEDDSFEDGSSSKPKKKLKKEKKKMRKKKNKKKKAYTSELEREHEELKQENAMLRKQQEQLLLSAPAQVVPKKPTHNRSFTAPF